VRERILVRVKVVAGPKRERTLVQAKVVAARKPVAKESPAKIDRVKLTACGLVV
jgi:hypothetical protein